MQYGRQIRPCAQCYQSLLLYTAGRMRPNPCLKESLRAYRCGALFPWRSSCPNCSTRQFRQRHPVVAPAFSTGIGPCGNSAHQQSPSGLQLMGAPQRAHRVSMTLFSPIAPLIEPYCHTNLSAHFVPRLTQLRICGKLNVYAAWFLRGCSVTGECFGPARPEREATELSCRYKPKWIQSSYATFALLRTSTTANPRLPTACSK